MTFKLLLKILILTLIPLLLMMGLLWRHFTPLNNNFEDKIGKWVDTNCVVSSNSCVLKISDLTPFIWDKMFVFQYTIGDENLEEILGAKPPVDDSGDRKIVFVKQGQVVLYENFPTNREGLVNRQVLFDIPDDKRYEIYTPDTAIFTVSKSERESEVYYDLNRIK